MTLKTGLDCQANYNSGTWGSPTWVEVKAVESTINFDRTAVPANQRGSSYGKKLPGLVNLSVDVKVLRNRGDAAQTALIAAFDAGTPIGMAFTDGPIATTGTKGVKGEFLVTKCAEGEPLEGAATLDFSFEPHAGTSNEPARFLVS